jgi:lysophospholipase L1-like esterase
VLHGSQYRTARAFLQAHRGRVALITIDIGGNDIVGYGFSLATGNPKGPCVRHALARIRRNLTRILAGLHAAAPGVIVLNPMPPQ